MHACPCFYLQASGFLLSSAAGLPDVGISAVETLVILHYVKWEAKTDQHSALTMLI